MPELTSSPFDALYTDPESQTGEQSQQAPPESTPGAEPTEKKTTLIPGTHPRPTGEQEIGTDEFTGEVLKHLPADSMFRRGGVAGEILGATGQRAFCPLSVDATRLLIDRHLRLARWVKSRPKRGGEGEGEADLQFVACSRDNGGLVLARAANEPAVPELRIITSFPVFDPDFSLSPTGFNGGIYFDQPEDLRGLVPQTDVSQIRATLDDLVVDFPFKDEASRQNYFGLLLTPFTRPAIQGNAPLHLIMSPLERTGKTKLAELLGMIVVGEKTPAQTMPEGDGELDKRVLAMLLSGQTLLHIDNVREYLDSAVLASLLTSSSYKSRLLGSSRMAEVPNGLTIVATGNNPLATGEIVKRTVPICLQPDTDAPEHRTDFQHPDLWGYVRTKRREVLECLLGAVLLWKEHGRKQSKATMGGFEEWAATVGGILDGLGYKQWLTNAGQWRQAADPRGDDLRALVSEWWRRHGDSPLKVPDILEIVRDLDLFPQVHAKETPKACQTALGMLLGRHVNAPVRIALEDESHTLSIQRNTVSRPALYTLRPPREVSR